MTSFLISSGFNYHLDSIIKILIFVVIFFFFFFFLPWCDHIIMCLVLSVVQIHFCAMIMSMYISILALHHQNKLLFLFSIIYLRFAFSKFIEDLIKTMHKIAQGTSMQILGLGIHTHTLTLTHTHVRAHTCSCTLTHTYMHTHA